MATDAQRAVKAPEPCTVVSSPLAASTALDAVAGIERGLFTAEDLVNACLEQIERVDERVQAWAFLDPEHALTQARERDAERREGKTLGPLHGVPVGIKDIIDTGDMPTEDGTVLHAGRRPFHDATVVERLRQAGAVIMGKTVTTELATYHAGKTRNPHDPDHSPGGSSSGSAAAVASHMVPVAIGTQTNGSVIRPAAYCGVYGFKPTFGVIPRFGILKQSRPLDQVGVMARTLDDIAATAEVLAGYDDGDPDSRREARPRLLEVSRQEPPLPPKLLFLRTAAWSKADAETQEAFAELTEQLGGSVAELPLPEPFDRAFEWHKLIMEADLARSFEIDYDQGYDQLSESLRGQVERGRKVTAVDYNNAVARIPFLNGALEDMMDRFHAILTPAATGTAPRFEAGTGDPIFSTLWTLCGMPAVTLPLMQGSNGLPLGVQVVGLRGDDARLLRVARWLERQLAE